MPAESHIYYIDPLEQLKKKRLIHFQSIILKAASVTVKKIDVQLWKLISLPIFIQYLFFLVEAF